MQTKGRSRDRQDVKVVVFRSGRPMAGPGRNSALLEADKKEREHFFGRLSPIRTTGAARGWGERESGRREGVPTGSHCHGRSRAIAFTGLSLPVWPHDGALGWR
jgi:hypothetical protein